MWIGIICVQFLLVLSIKAKGVVGVRHVWSLYLSFDCCYINLLGKEGEEEQEEEEEQRSKIEYLECEV